jgi:hypothetical protein
MHRQHVHPQTLQILGIRDTIGHIAARHDHVDIFDLWHAHGGSIMDRTDNGMSIGHVAGQCGSSRVLAQWFTCGGDPSVVSGYGMTIGHTIAYTAHLRSSQHDGYMQCLSTWIDAGGHPDVHDHQGCSIGCHALRHENMAMLRGWIERGGCIFGHTGTQDIIKAVCAMPSTVVDHTKPCIVIAKTALRCMGFDLPHLPYMEEKAFRDQKGSAYAMRVLASMPDPIAMGMFAMVIDRYASAP